MANVSAFEYMIKNNLYEYSCDPWCVEPMKSHFYSTKGFSGQIGYQDEIFIVNYETGHHGSGGMDEGSPDSVKIYRIKK